MENINPVLLALIATIFTWLMTAIGASVVFSMKEMNKRLLDGMLGFAGGVMIAASYWSLLEPAITMSSWMGMFSWVPAVVGFLTGGAFLLGIDKLLPHLHLGFPIESKEGLKTSWKRTTLLMLAITMHNIPEGLAIGVAFGALSFNEPSISLSGATALAIGIGIQNLPEGAAISIPLRREGFSRWKSFFYGQLSGVVEPLAAVIGALFVFYAGALLPYALSFAAGAMIYVVIEEVIPESQSSNNTDTSTISSMLGFALMMMLDVMFSK
jgi:ZIP family zinc transporter